MAKKRVDTEDFGIPVWTEMPASWYQKLNRLARKYGVTRREILESSLKAYGQKLKYENSSFRSVEVSAVQEANAKQIFGRFSKDWWDSMTPAERKAQSEKRSEAAKRRWKNRGKGPLGKA